MSDLDLRAEAFRAGTSYKKNLRGSTDGFLLTDARYRELAMRGQVYTFSRAAVTLPVNTSNLVSVFGIYNPPGSNKFLELIDVEVHAVLATTVVNAVGLYVSSVNLSAAATFTTQTNVGLENGRPGEGSQAAALPYSAVTHSGTPRLLDIIGGWGAVTDGGSTPVRKDFNGKWLIPPGMLLSLAMTTAASTGSGITAMLRWAEVSYEAI